ncbi:MAG TPA: LytTR family DNA-binding domain-containing protein [Bacteroidales bacterium]|nr:LytTR family DNA-binding domain-containing protein [Bacteroidales bacterium]
MKEIKAIVVDDEPLALEVIENYSNKIPSLSIIKQCHSAMEAAEELSKSNYDLLILDIQMPQITGIELVKSLTHPPHIIFTTAHSDFAVEGFDLNAVDFLLKPFTFDRFLKAIQKVNQRATETQRSNTEDTNDSDPPFIYVKADKKLTKVNFDDIYYIEGLKDYVIIKRAKDRIVTLQTMKGLEKKLPSNLFMRVHRSYILALDKIEAVVGNSVELNISGEKKSIPIGKNYRDEILQVINENRL